MKNSLLEDGISLVIGAAAGAALTYLLDPLSGEQRREHLTEMAGGSLGTAKEKISAALDAAVDYAKGARDHAAQHTDGASQFGTHLVDHAKQLLETAKGYVGSGKTTAADLHESAKETIRQSIDHHAARLGYRQSSPKSSAAAHSLGTVGLLAIGVGAMYFFDPQQGRSRRAMVSEKVGGAVSDIGKMARAAGRNLAQCSHDAYDHVEEMIHPQSEQSANNPDTALPASDVQTNPPTDYSRPAPTSNF